MIKKKRNKRTLPSRAVRRSTIFRPKQPCALLSEGINEVDYKDLSLIRNYVNEEWKIRPARIGNVCAKMQRQIKTAVKRARLIALLPYTNHHHVRKDS